MHTQSSRTQDCGSNGSSLVKLFLILKVASVVASLGSD